MPDMPVVYHIPVCPFSQRLEILLSLKGAVDAVKFRVVDITRPRDPALLELTRGSTALPILVTNKGVLKESLVILDYLDARSGHGKIARADPYEHAVEAMLIAMEGDFTGAGYRYVLNQDEARRSAFSDAMLAQYQRLDDFLVWQNPEGTFLFEQFGLAEAVFTPMFMRFWFLDYYEGFDLPESGFARVRRWRDACLAHPAAQQVNKEQVIKLYYDYAMGAGNGALVPGRTVSSFTFEPAWQQRPWPPPQKYSGTATDAQLGLAG
ncbi:MAG TPA: glutathione S-transferase family protein [Pelagibacterium sp.]|uniref:glutathione S-transferase family protein n=1 Tax=Pelagibacterium sp. TaxID=1967288 RepID=UPI002BC32089|nr:glutathione S-transferase family protein [Pelagibacterium sp.]HWJ87066.1 glutathione S-transferase family protein [Pelagibacterium sp.]